MIYKVQFTGFCLVEADSIEEAEDKAYNDDWIEESKSYEQVEEFEGYEI